MTALLALLGVQLLLALATALLVIPAAGEMWRADAGFGVSAGATARAAFSLFEEARDLLPWEAVGLVIAFVLFPAWLYRFVSTFAVQVGGVGRSARWVAISSVVPAVNLVVPYLALMDLHRRLHGPDACLSGRRLIQAWWAGSVLLTGLVAVQAFLVLGDIVVFRSGDHLAVVAVVQTGTFMAIVLQIGAIRHIQVLGDLRAALLRDPITASNKLADKSRSRRRILLPVGVAIAGVVASVGFLVLTALQKPVAHAWATYQDPAGAFSVMLPRVPTVVEDIIGDGKATRHWFESPVSADEWYLVYYIDLPPEAVGTYGPEAFLDGWVEQSLAGNVMLTESVQLGVVPGRRVHGVTSSGTTVDERYFLRGDRFYGLKAEALVTLAPSANFDRFFSSFVLP